MRTQTVDYLCKFVVKEIVLVKVKETVVVKVKVKVAEGDGVNVKVLVKVGAKSTKSSDVKQLELPAEKSA
ncbi:MAG: hypothetical protein HRU34_18440 [Richelia sp.]|nr:hypothetical protein [Richelia sp.]